MAAHARQATQKGNVQRSSPWAGAKRNMPTIGAARESMPGTWAKCCLPAPCSASPATVAFDSLCLACSSSCNNRHEPLSQAVQRKLPTSNFRQHGRNKNHIPVQNCKNVVPEPNKQVGVFLHLPMTISTSIEIPIQKRKEAQA
jgi:hypothetical protein